MTDRTGAHVGADIGGTKTAAVLCGDDGAILAKTWIEHDPNRSEPIEDRILRAVRKVTAGASELRVRSLGVSVAGLISHDNRTIVHAATLGAQNLHLADWLEARHPGRFTIVNDANATLVGHLSEEDPDHRNVVLLSLGTGIGGAVAVDGAVVHGGHGFAAELGHLTVDFDDPRRCLCGAPGCVENYASGRGLVEMAAEAGIGTGASSYDSRSLIALAVEDSRARGIIEHAGAMLGRAIAQLGTVLDPEEFVIGGSVGHAAADLLLPAARTEMAARWPFAHVRPLPEVRVDAIGPYAAAIGAARIARNHDTL